MAALDEGHYPTGIEITDEQFHSINIERDDVHGEWNYKILPQSTQLIVQLILSAYIGI